MSVVRNREVTIVRFSEVKNVLRMLKSNAAFLAVRFPEVVRISEGSTVYCARQREDCGKSGVCLPRRTHRNNPRQENRRESRENRRKRSPAAFAVNGSVVVKTKSSFLSVTASNGCTKCKRQNLPM